MAKVRGPILSIGAGGQIGKSQVYASWRGVPYARQYVIPSNPNTTAQQETRSTFKTLQEMWKQLPSANQDIWIAAAKGRPFTDRNKHTQVNLPGLRGAANMNTYVASPGVNGGVPMVDAALADGAAGEIDATPTLGDLPTGWTTVGVTGIAFPDQDPALAFEGPVQVQTNAVAPYGLTFTGLTTGTDYQVSVWWHMQKADGTDAYSVAITGQHTAP